MTRIIQIKVKIANHQSRKRSEILAVEELYLAAEKGCYSANLFKISDHTMGPISQIFYFHSTKAPETQKLQHCQQNLRINSTKQLTHYKAYPRPQTSLF